MGSRSVHCNNQLYLFIILKRSVIYFQVTHKDISVNKSHLSMKAKLSIQVLRLVTHEGVNVLTAH